MSNSQIFTVFLTIICCYGYCCGSSRNISCFVNPGLNDTSRDDLNANVIHIVSEGKEDVIHCIWSTYNLPSVIISRTTKNTTLFLNTTKLISFENDAIIFKGDKPLEMVGLTFSKLWELQYLKNATSIRDIHSLKDLDMESLYWSGLNETLNCSDSFASVTLRSSNEELAFSKNGTFNIQFSISADQELSNEFPHLIFTGNSTLLKLVLNDLYSNSSKVRYGFEVSIFSDFSNDCDKSTWNTVTSRSINDEFSPGVFTNVELLSECSGERKESSFISWRPVAYTSDKPIVANSSDVTMMTDPMFTPDVAVQSIAELYFADRTNASSFNITFGTQGDGFYIATKYTSWSLMLGTGSVVELPLSTSVIIFAFVGLGLILLFSIGGIVFLLVHKCKEKDDDLLLN